MPALFLIVNPGLDPDSPGLKSPRRAHLDAGVSRVTVKVDRPMADQKAVQKLRAAQLRRARLPVVRATGHQSHADSPNQPRKSTAGRQNLA